MNRLNKIILFGIIIFSLVFRFYNLERHTGFDADQEELAFRAKELLTGNPVLLGPKTSIGAFSIGPGFIYLWAIVSFFMKGAPVAGAVLSVILGVVSVFLIYFVGKKIIGTRSAIILAFIWAFSSNMILWDQAPWAPSLFYVSELLMIYGAFISIKDKKGIFWVALGLAVGIQAHVAIFLTLFAIFVFWLFNKPILKIKEIFYSVAILLLGTSTLIVYDLTHHFVNFHRIVGVFNSPAASVPATIEKVLKSGAISIGRVFSPSFPENVAVILFPAIFVFGFYYLAKLKKDRPLLLLLYLEVVIPILFFLFYRSNFSEYYLMPVIPAFLYLIGYLINKLPKKFYLVIYIGLLIFAVNNIGFIKNYKKVMSLWDKRQAVQLVKSKWGTDGYGISISYEAGNNFGFKYLFNYYGITAASPPKKGETKIFTIAVPNCVEGVCGKLDFDGVGVLWTQ